MGFRSETIMDSFNYLSKMFFEFNIPNKYWSLLPNIIILTLIDYFIRKDERLIFKTSFVYRYLLYIILSLMIVFSSMENSAEEFIYFNSEMKKFILKYRPLVLLFLSIIVWFNFENNKIIQNA